MKTSRTQKISLVILSVVVLALLAPYAGCNQILSGTHTEHHSESEPEDSPPLDSSETDANKGEPLDQIEDLLSD